MTNVNSGVIVGRLGRDMEVKYATSGFAIGKFSIANNQSRKVGDQWEDQTHWFDCTLLGKRAEALAQYLVKGAQVVIQYTLQQEKWQDKNSGENRSKVSLLVNDINLVGGKSENSGGGSSEPAIDFSSDIPF